MVVFEFAMFFGDRLEKGCLYAGGPTKSPEDARQSKHQLALYRRFSIVVGNHRGFEGLIIFGILSFSLDQPAVSNDHVSAGFAFTADNAQMNLAPGETLTQSYNVNVADAQNPAQNASQTVSVTIGGAGDDHFVFKPGIGADTLTSFNPQLDTLELDHFANAHTAQELQALITADVHGDAVINLGHNDSITVAGVTITELQHVIQAGHILLH